MTYTISQPFGSAGLVVTFYNDTAQTVDSPLFNVYANGQPVATGGSNQVVLPGESVKMTVTADALKYNNVRPGQSLTVRPHLSSEESNAITYASITTALLLGGLGLYLLWGRGRK